MRWFYRKSWVLAAIALMSAGTTIECLGCEAFDPMLRCAAQASGDMGMGPSSNPATSGSGHSAASTKAPACECGCTSCHAVVSAELALNYSTTEVSIRTTPPSTANPAVIIRPQLRPPVIVL